MPSRDLTEFRKEIGYRFHDLKLLKQALTHTSYCNEHGLSKTDSNERMEFFKMSSSFSIRSLTQTSLYTFHFF